ncbi:transmembrane protein 107 [Lethenteron reissneri]|uniref:transmembrane protein 107 n=1 Tax=Lethenteron reissneri TaxID=7753 RepID=UPI002AB5F0EB|nr:transmembrane protein 107 [Lethenteron reissneri]XP_061422266.1 transmembrane protein 107 [Lethenteron reissneri]XP_061422267.1 transmembrane protein 107 [Lethenteron reissneri]
MRAASGLVGLRLVSLCGHAAQVAAALWAAVASAWRCGDGALGRDCAEENLIACIPVPRITENQTPTNEVVIPLALTLAALGVELIGFITGMSVHSSSQSLLSIGCHSSAGITMAFYLFDYLACDAAWWLLGFCSVPPAVLEVVVVLSLLLNKRPY